ncbi:MAG TPA: rRNA adenine dimethyltransferase family protein [Candidatus Saccharimonadales bacterium]|nr:rRNA adenine dimethyltransferase family protein [Candidatus Saccharimonadales bacterium]
MKRLSIFSQHFLRSPLVAAELIGHAAIKPTDTVYDIGAGSGVITMALARRCKAVVAIEVDPRMAAKLRQNMQTHTNVTVHQTDFLSMPLPQRPYKIFSNIPFSLSSAIVHKITEAASPPEVAYLIVQKQFAQKLQPDSARYTSQLGMLLGPSFAVRIRKHLHRSDFAPPPHVDTVLLEIKRRPEPLIPVAQLPLFKRFITQCFTNPQHFAGMPLVAAGIKPGLKASQLTLKDWLVLFAATSTK